MSWITKTILTRFKPHFSWPQDVLLKENEVLNLLSHDFYFIKNEPSFIKNKPIAPFTVGRKYVCNKCSYKIYLMNFNFKEKTVDVSYVNIMNRSPNCAELIMNRVLG